MKRPNTVIAAVATAAVLLAASCTKEEKENFTFSVSDSGGNAVSGIQEFSYGESRDWQFSATEVSKITLDTPEGWDARVIQAEKAVRITAPGPRDKDLEENGTVRITATSYQASTITVSIDVAVKDNTISFSLEGAEEGLEVKYSETVTLQASVSNVAGIRYTAPKGWTVAYDEATAKVGITAPGFNDTDIETEGSITITPESARGNAGSPVSFNVRILASAPVLVLDMEGLERVPHSSTNVLKSTECVNLCQIEMQSAPEGWTVNASLQGETAEISVTSPAIGAERYTGAGDITLQLVSETGEMSELSVPVSMLGINDASDFLAFADAYTNDEDCSRYIDDGQYILNSDIDISHDSRALYVNRNFSGTFNGDGHTITYRIKAETGDAGLFQTVLGDGTVKNLKIAGTLEITDKTDRAAGIASYSTGGTFENIVSTVAYIEEGGSRGMMLGGIVADETRQGTYRNCHNRGKFTVNALQFLGGLIADVWDNPGSQMYDCSNEADMEIDMLGINMGNSWFGGLIGKSDGSDFQIYRSFNKGNITLDFGGSKTNLAGVGGIAGFACGYYEDCYNEGDITDINKDDFSGSARIGGLAGCVQNAQGYMLKANNCYNTGDITALGEGVGGLIGIVRDGPEGAMSLTGCHNEGKVDCRSGISSVQSFGGLIGTVYNCLEMNNCTNRGDVMGYTSVGGAGLIGRGADNITVSGCTNTGNVYVGAHSDAIGNYPLAAGLVAGIYPTITITNSSNTGNIFAMVQKEGCASRTFVSDRILSGNSDASSVDEATVSASESASVTLILKDSWTDTFPAEWTK